MVNRRQPRALLAGALCALAVAFLPAMPASAAPWRTYPAGEAPTDRIIVRWRDEGVTAMQIPSNVDRSISMGLVSYKDSARECIKAGWACQSNRIELSLFFRAKWGRVLHRNGWEIRDESAENNAS